MTTKSSYATKLERIESQTLLPKLPRATREYLRRLASTHRFTFQELRRASQAARDLQMWQEEPFEDWWTRAERTLSLQGRERKKELFRRLDRHMLQTASAEKVYPQGGLHPPARRRVRLREVRTDKQVFGLCPAYSEQTVCCGLHTLDAVRGCPYSCSYCTIQTFYGETAELESDLMEKLGSIELEPGRRYHIGTGQSSDSLVWGNRGGLLDALIHFARANPNVLLELKTKSANVEPLLSRELPANIVCTWSLGTPTTIGNEEPGTASLPQRLEAASRASARGIDVGFHFHPMIFYAGWKKDYERVALELLDRFDPVDVAFISMGSVTLIRPVERAIRDRGGETKILQMDMAQDAHGKLTYRDEIKIDLFSHLYSALAPWHEKVFFYLCMENRLIWEQVFGAAYSSNRLFEEDFLDHCLRTERTAEPAQ